MNHTRRATGLFVLFLVTTAALLTSVAMPEAAADSWAAPRPLSSSSLDGRWYVIVQPEAGRRDASFQLVKRAPGASPRPEPPIAWRRVNPTERFAIEKGDKVVVRGSCPMPLRVRCLNGGAGFILFETYGGLGGKNVIERRDREGKTVWKHGLRDLFSDNVIRSSFIHSVSSIRWFNGIWLDEAHGQIGVVTRTSALPGLLRLKLQDGTPSPLAPTELLPQLRRGAAQDRILALDTAEKLEVGGLSAAARAAFADEAAPPLARAHLAMYLHTQRESIGRTYVVTAAGLKTRDLELRRYATGQLSSLLGAKALPLLRRSMRDDDVLVQDAAEKGMQALGSAAVDTLLEMLGEEGLSEEVRLAAIQVLSYLGRDAERALPGLDALAQDKSIRVSRAAKSAARSIRDAFAATKTGRGH